MDFIQLVLHIVWSSVRHPRTQIYINPVGTTSPLPWWGSLCVIACGVISWCTSEVMHIPSLAEAARAMVYIPLGNIFGMTIGLKDREHAKRS